MIGTAQVTESTTPPRGRTSSTRKRTLRPPRDSSSSSSSTVLSTFNEPRTLPKFLQAENLVSFLAPGPLQLGRRVEARFHQEEADLDEVPLGEFALLRGADGLAHGRELLTKLLVRDGRPPDRVVNESQGELAQTTGGADHEG